MQTARREANNCLAPPTSANPSRQQDKNKPPKKGGLFLFVAEVGLNLHLIFAELKALCDLKASSLDPDLDLVA